MRRTRFRGSFQKMTLLFPPHYIHYLVISLIFTCTNSNMSAPAAPAPAAPAAPLGILPSGIPVRVSFQPSVASLAILLTPHLKILSDVSGVLPLPAGLSLVRSPGAAKCIQLRVAPFFARKLKRVFGYVDEILLINGAGTTTPAQLQVVIRIPWRYGSTAREAESSWALARLIAFTSKALFADADRVGPRAPFFFSFLPPCFLERGTFWYQAGYVCDGFY